MSRASDWLGPRGPLARAIEGYEHRPSQMAMADAVEDAIEHDGVLLVEAGTGTGKTWAYLAAALRSGRKVVVSTGTKALQDQIVDRDLPTLLRHLELRESPRVACMKGLANYLCLRRYEEFRSSADAVFASAELGAIERWRESTRTGDRGELPLHEDLKVWPKVASGSDTRIGPKCAFHEQCFVTKMRRDAEEAQIVVVNHHLYFADLAIRASRQHLGGAVIPEHDAVIFDEAHRLESVATLFFGTTISTTQLERLARDASRSLRAARDGSALPEVLRGAADNFFLALPRPPEREGSRATLQKEDFTGALEERFFKLDDALEALGSHCKLRASTRDDERQPHHEALAQIGRRCGALRDALARVTEGATGESVAWTSKRGHGVAIGLSPIRIGRVLESELFGRSGAIVMTSATLSTGGTFEYLKQQVGIDFEVDELRLPSPFDYGRQVGLYVPESMPDPRHPRFVEEATERILSLVGITEGGAFVLCTSRRNMYALADACRPTLVDRKHPVLVQGEAPKLALLERFQEAEDAVLFATASFWEGVDVPGRALRLVVIDKLPFEVPSDPLVQARCQALEERGGNPFLELLVPAAALSLEQGFGRLIRTRRDRGIVAILDSRLAKKSYGRHFLETLPDASRLYSDAEARAFWDLGALSL